MALTPCGWPGWCLAGDAGRAQSPDVSFAEHYQHAVRNAQANDAKHAARRRDHRDHGAEEETGWNTTLNSVSAAGYVH